MGQGILSRLRGKKEINALIVGEYEMTYKYQLGVGEQEMTYIYEYQLGVGEQEITYKYQPGVGAYHL